MRNSSKQQLLLTRIIKNTPLSFINLFQNSKTSELEFTAIVSNHIVHCIVMRL